jgi:hypothetical protein
MITSGNNVPYFFVKKVEEINTILLNQQCKIIYSYLEKLPLTNKDILENNSSLKYIKWKSMFM